MKTTVRKNNTARLPLLLATSIVAAALSPSANAFPVFDALNFSQNIVTAIENVAHTAKQIQQYQTQLDQYQNMLQNTTGPKQHIWDAATVTMNQLRSSIDTLSYYKANLGSLDAYLGKFKDTEGYRNSSCYSVNGCTPAQWAAMRDAEKYGSQSQKRATDALFRGLDRQHENLQADAAQLQRLQSSAQGSDGQMQALGYANQLASHQSNQLLQIRALLIAQQNAIATRNQALADREAREAAATEAIRSGTFTRTPATRTY